jgi:hypothetical protein
MQLTPLNTPNSLYRYLVRKMLILLLYQPKLRSIFQTNLLFLKGLFFPFIRELFTRMVLDHHMLNHCYPMFAIIFNQEEIIFRFCHKLNHLYPMDSNFTGETNSIERFNIRNVIIKCEDCFRLFVSKCFQYLCFLSLPTPII